jgi:hypothetical protein
MPHLGELYPSICLTTDGPVTDMVCGGPGVNQVLTLF